MLKANVSFLLIDFLILRTILETNKQTKNYMSNEIEKKIRSEKRKRSQIYLALNHFLTLNTYFDFFSFDAFKIAQHSQSLAQSVQSKTVSCLHLLIPFIEGNSEITKILEEYGLNKEALQSVTKSASTNNFFSFKDRVSFYLNLSFLRKKRHRDNSINFSFEVNQIFEKATENALVRFKTPVITSEILFITLMEDKGSKVEKLINQVIPDKTQWYLLRYKLIKRIHSNELNVRTNVQKNEHYFAYLLKTQIPQIQFDRLIDNQLLALGVIFFRNKLLSKIRALSLPVFLEKEIYRSIKITATRKYSS
jgi:hypothetical protein